MWTCVLCVARGYPFLSASLLPLVLVKQSVSMAIPAGRTEIDCDVQKLHVG